MVKNSDFDLLTCTKNLQQQYVDEFPYIHNLWGKSNYTCDKCKSTCETGHHYNKQKGESCDMCPHTKAQSNWIDGAISLTNFHIHGLFCLYDNPALLNRSAEVLIVDEAHEYEKTLSGFVSLTINKKTWEDFAPVTKSLLWNESIFRFTNTPEIIEWIEIEYLPTLNSKISEIDRETKTLKDQKKLMKDLKILKSLSDYSNSIKAFIKEYRINPNNYLCDKKTVKGEATWLIQPLWINDILKRKVWDRYKHVILMSGTIIDPEMFCKIHGIDIGEAVFLRQNSPFPVENRPLYYKPLGKMSYKNKEEVWKDYVPFIKKVLAKYKGKKGIIHSGNYELTEWLKRDIIDDRLLFVKPNQRMEDIELHMNATHDSVIVSPSLTTGIDLKDDLSRFQLILKVPYPSLASKLYKTRFEEVQKWYAWSAIMDIIQAYGRSIRSDEDYADTIILDGCFSDLINRNSQMFPKYVLEALKYI